MNSIINFIYDKIRKYYLYRNDYDVNEDFFCCICGKPVLRRVLICEDCSKLYDKINALSVVVGFSYLKMK